MTLEDPGEKLRKGKEPERMKQREKKSEQTIAKNQHPLEKRKKILHSKELTYSKSSLRVKLVAH